MHIILRYSTSFTNILIFMHHVERERIITYEHTLICSTLTLNPIYVDGWSTSTDFHLTDSRSLKQIPESNQLKSLSSRLHNCFRIVIWDDWEVRAYTIIPPLSCILCACNCTWWIPINTIRSSFDFHLNQWSTSPLTHTNYSWVFLLHNLIMLQGSWDPTCHEL